MRTLKIGTLILTVLLAWGMVAPSPAQAAEATYTASPNAAIPDEGAAIFSSISVPAGTTVETLVVTINIAHTHSSDLRITLSHNGQQVSLMSQLGQGSGFGCSADGLMVSFTATAAQPLSQYDCSDDNRVVTGVWRGEGNLAVYNGRDAGGTWELSVQDVVVNDTGTLRDWSITLNAPDVATVDAGFSFALVNRGEVMIRAIEPIPVHMDAMGQVVRDANAQEVWLPHDFDGNGYDTYVVADVVRTETDGIWLGLFIGANKWGWVRLDDVIPMRYIDDIE